MKNIYILTTLFISLSSCTKKEVIILESSLPEYIFYLSGEIYPYTGKCIVYFPRTTIIKEEMTYKKGILHGAYTSYYINSHIKRKGEYRNGKFNGCWEYWCESGGKSYQVNFRNDSLNGEYLTYYSSGKLREQGNYMKNLRTGTWYVYDEDGTLQEKEVIK